MNALYNANIQDETSTGLTSFAFPEAKSSQTGVSVRYAPTRSDDLSTLSHDFPEWQAYKERIADDSEKSSFPINPNLFFEVYDDGRGVFNEDPKMLAIAKEMWNEHNATV